MRSEPFEATCSLRPAFSAADTATLLCTCFTFFVVNPLANKQPLQRNSLAQFIDISLCKQLGRSTEGEEIT